jgi:hypothetical protein
MAYTNGNTATRDVEIGVKDVHHNDHAELVHHENKSKRDAEEFHGFLSRQFPQIANPAPLGLGGFALTTFVLSMFNAGAIVGKSSYHV